MRQKEKVMRKNILEVLIHLDRMTNYFNANDIECIEKKDIIISNKGEYDVVWMIHRSFGKLTIAIVHEDNSLSLHSIANTSNKVGLVKELVLRKHMTPKYVAELLNSTEKDIMECIRKY